MRKWILAVGILAVAGFGIWSLLELRARSWEGKWRAFVNQWEAKGESFGVEENLPAAIADEDEFASHPWIRRIVAEDPEVLERLRQLEPQTVAGYADWQATEAAEDVTAPMPVELAERLRKHAAGFRHELDAFADALRRSGCRLSPADGKAPAISAGWVKQLTPLSHLLEGLSHAAIAMDDSAAFTEAIEISLRAGEKLRASNLMLGVVVGAGFDSRVYETLGRIPASRKWPDVERAKWLAALDFRKRPLAEEFAAALRVERGLYLEMIREMEKTPVVRTSISRLPQFQRRHFARTKLALCEELQETVLSDGGTPQTSVDPATWKRFSDAVATRKDESGAEKFGHAIYFITKGISDALVIQESDRTTIRAKLNNELRLGSR